MSCTAGCIKCILNTVNTLWAIFSVLILVVAGLIANVAPTLLLVLLFIVGAVSLTASLLGCCGICQENVCMTTAYAALILASLILQICSIFFVGGVEGIRKYADEEVSKTWEKELKAPGAMDFTQQYFQCCGLNGPSDYELISRPTPDSCYVIKNGNKGQLFNDGCIKKAEDEYVKLLNGMTSGSWGSIIFSIIMLIFAIYLIMRFRKQQRPYNY